MHRSLGESCPVQTLRLNHASLTAGRGHETLSLLADSDTGLPVPIRRRLLAGQGMYDSPPASCPDGKGLAALFRGLTTRESDVSEVQRVLLMGPGAVGGVIVAGLMVRTETASS